MSSKNRKVLTLVLLRQENRVLLGMKKRGFGVGKWNGFGGKLEPGETVVEAAAREVREECGYIVNTTDLGTDFGNFGNSLAFNFLKKMKFFLFWFALEISKIFPMKI